MYSQPVIEYRDELAYAAIRTRVAMQAIPAVLPPLIPEVFEWLEKNGIKPSGQAFFRYLAMDKNNVMDAEVGVFVSNKPEGSGRVQGGTFPAGKYLTSRHTGPYHLLPQSHSAMDGFARQNGLKEGMQAGENGERLGTRTEIYITHPDEEPDSSKWITDLMFLLEE